MYLAVRITDSTNWYQSQDGLCYLFEKCVKVGCDLSSVPAGQGLALVTGKTPNDEVETQTPIVTRFGGRGVHDVYIGKIAGA